MSQQKNNHFSRKIIAVLEIIATFARDYQINPIGEVLEWLKRHAWKACSRQNRLAGSNPVLSAIKTLSKEDLADARHAASILLFIPLISHQRSWNLNVSCSAHGGRAMPERCSGMPPTPRWVRAPDGRRINRKRKVSASSARYSIILLSGKQSQCVVPQIVSIV